MMSYELFLAELFRFYLGFIMLAAAWGKSRTYTYFQQQLTESFGIKPVHSRVLAPGVLALEWLLALVILTTGHKAFIILAGGVFSLFSAVLLYRYFTEGLIKCSCFGETDRPVTDYDLLRNGIVIIAFSFFVWFDATNSALALSWQFFLAGLATLLALITINLSDIMLQLIDMAEADR